jgi:hypothetical protein
MARTTRAAAAKAGSGRSPTRAAKAARTVTKTAKAAKTTVRQGKQLKAPKKQKIANIPAVRVTQTSRSDASARSVTRRPPGQSDADVLVELPGGTARITIQAKAGVRRTTRDWLRIIEALARASLSPSDLRERLSEEPVGQQLTPAEVSELEEAGARSASTAASTAVRADALAWQVTFAVAAYDVAAVANRLGVDPTRVRQRLRERTLYGLRGESRTWRLPRFQFDDAGHEIPHIGQVLRVLPPGLHPRAVEGFLTSPKPELMSDGEPRTPRDWLLSGGPADPVVALATSLAAQ